MAKRAFGLRFINLTQGKVEVKIRPDIFCPVICRFACRVFYLWTQISESALLRQLSL
jgi:hypothetical protein